MAFSCSYLALADHFSLDIAPPDPFLPFTGHRLGPASGAAGSTRALRSAYDWPNMTGRNVPQALWRITADFWASCCPLRLTLPRGRRGGACCPTTGVSRHPCHDVLWLRRVPVAGSDFAGAAQP